MKSIYLILLALLLCISASSAASITTALNVTVTSSQVGPWMVGNSSYNQTLTLPDAALTNFLGKEFAFTIKVNPGTHWVRLVGTGGDTIGGAAIYATTDYPANVVIYSDGTNWLVKSYKGLWYKDGVAETLDWSGITTTQIFPTDLAMGANDITGAGNVNATAVYSGGELQRNQTQPYDYLFWSNGVVWTQYDNDGTIIAGGVSGVGDADALISAVSSTPYNGRKIVLDGYIYMPAGKTITFPNYPCWLDGSGADSILLMMGSKLAIQAGYQSKITNINILQKNNTYINTYDGIYLDSEQMVIIDDVTINYPKNGLIISGASYFDVVDGIRVTGFTECGIKVNSSAGLTPNSNRVRFTLLDAITKGTSTGVYVDGYTNTITGGEVQNVHVGINVSGDRNWFTGFWIEAGDTYIHARSGINYVSLWSIGPKIIEDGAMLISPDGNNVFGSDIPISSIALLRNLSALYFFNETSGTSIHDRSGNANTGTWFGTPTYTNAGAFGQGVLSSNASHVMLPTNVVNLSEPFSMCVLWEYRVLPVSSAYMHGIKIQKRSSPWHYVGISPKLISNSISYYNETTGTTVYDQIDALSANTQIGVPFWTMIYVDLTNHTIESLDCAGGYGDSATIGDAFVPTDFQLDGFTSSDATMLISYALLFQRKLSLNECYLIQNSKIPIHTGYLA